MAAADYRLLTEATGVRIAEALEDVTAMVGPKGDTGEVSEAELTAKLADKADVIIDTASGAIASFPDGMAAPAKDVTISIGPVQSGSGDPSPTNVRPISGWTGANVTMTGKNWIPEFPATAPGNGTVLQEFPVYKIFNGFRLTFTFSGSFINDGASMFAIQNEAGINVPVIPRECKKLSDDTKLKKNTTYTNEKVYFASSSNILVKKILWYNYPAFTGLSIANMMFTEGASAVDYEPYGETIPISWQSEAGTVYGGTLDVTTGLLTVNRAMVDLGTLDWSIAGSYDNLFKATIPDIKYWGNNYEAPNIICEKYVAMKYISLNVNDNTTRGMSMLTNESGVRIKDPSYNNPSTFKAAMSGVQLVYELATPQTYQLSPTDVTLLMGDNNVWADTGDSTVTYRADTKLYVQKINAPTNDDMIADAQIASGKYFIIGGNLYKSTTTIPAGDTITPGTNCILTNLADALNALNT